MVVYWLSVAAYGPGLIGRAQKARLTHLAMVWPWDPSHRLAQMLIASAEFRHASSTMSRLQRDFEPKVRPIFEIRRRVARDWHHSAVIGGGSAKRLHMGSLPPPIPGQRKVCDSRRHRRLASGERLELGHCQAIGAGHQVRVSSRNDQAAMAQERLQRSEVATRGKEQRGEGVSERMRPVVRHARALRRRREHKTQAHRRIGASRRNPRFRLLAARQ